MTEPHQEIYLRLEQFRDRADELKGELKMVENLKEVLEKIEKLEADWNGFVVERKLGVIFL